MSHAPTHALARTEDKGGPSQPNSPSPPNANSLTGRRAGIKLVLSMGCPSFHSPVRGERIREDPTKPYPTFPSPSPRFGRNRERAV